MQNPTAEELNKSTQEVVASLLHLAHQRTALEDVRKEPASLPEHVSMAAQAHRQAEDQMKLHVEKHVQLLMKYLRSVEETMEQDTSGSKEVNRV